MSKTKSPKKFNLYVPTDRKLAIFVACILLLIGATVGMITPFFSKKIPLVLLIPWLAFMAFFTYLIIEIYTRGYFYVVDGGDAIVIKRRHRRDMTVRFETIKELRYTPIEVRRDEGFYHFPMMTVYSQEDNVLFYACESSAIIALFKSHGIELRENTY